MFASTEKNSRTLITGLLIEGYGHLLEKHYNKEGLARKFVLAFEELLIREQHRTRLLISDVLDWIIEERSEFSPFVVERAKSYKEDPFFKFITAFRDLENEDPRDPIEGDKLIKSDLLYTWIQHLSKINVGEEALIKEFWDFCQSNGVELNSKQKKAAVLHYQEIKDQKK